MGESPAVGIEDPVSMHVSMNPRLFLRPAVVGSINVLAPPAVFPVFVCVVGTEDGGRKPGGGIEVREFFGEGPVVMLVAGSGGTSALETVDEGLGW